MNGAPPPPFEQAPQAAFPQPAPEGPPSPERLLATAMILRGRLKAAAARISALPPDVRQEVSLKQQILARASELSRRIAEARSNAEALAAEERRVELLEKAEFLFRAIALVRARYEIAAEEAAKQALLRQLVELKAAAAKALASLRLIPPPDVITA